MNLQAMNIAVIGLGRMGLRHIEAIQKMGMNVCGLVDISTDALAQAEQNFNINQDCCFSDVQEMLKAKKPDGVVIATTAPTHAEYTVISAQHQVKYILCEKPMAVSLDEANAMIDACTHYNSILAINHQMMFLPQYTEIKDIIKSGSFGSLSSIIVSGSNFGLAMNASHYFEMFRYLTDSEVDTVQAWFEEERIPNPRGSQFEDYSGSLIAKNSQGIRMYIDFSAKAGHGLQTTYIFKYGQIVVDELSGFVRSICRNEEFKDLPTTRYGMPAEVKQYEIKAFEMIDSTIKVWNGMFTNTAFPDFNAGAHAMRCLVAAVESHEQNNQPVATQKISIDSSRTFKWA